MGVEEGQMNCLQKKKQEILQTPAPANNELSHLLITSKPIQAKPARPKGRHSSLKLFVLHRV